MIVIMAYLEDVLLPIFICVVLPIFIVFLVMNARKHEVSRKAEVALKAIEAGAPVDPNFFKTAKKKKEGIKERLLGQLTGACITFLMGAAFLAVNLLNWNDTGLHMFSVAGIVMMAIGLGLFISFFVSRSMLSREIEAEEKELENKAEE